MTDMLLVESNHGVVQLTINRPEKRNALSHELLAQLERALANIARRPGRPGRGPRFTRPGFLLGA